MIPRGKLSISTASLCTALFYCFSNKRRAHFLPDPTIFGDAIYCLSVRTGLNLVLKALNFAPHSQIIACSINIPDMFAIIAAHELECVPIAIQKQSLGINITEIENSITPFTKAILITHLFGAVISMDEVIALAKKHQLIVIEDCAQAFNFKYVGHHSTDVSLFSFGLIKTNTCLTGAIVCFNNKSLFEKVNLLNQQLPVQQQKVYLAKIFKALAIKLITVNWVYTILYHITLFLKKDFDEVLAGFTRGFPGSNVMEKIAFQPCEANLRLLQKRTNLLGDETIKKRDEIARQILAHIPTQMQIGCDHANRNHWVLALASKNQVSLIKFLRKNGIDATAKASSLIDITKDFKKIGDNELRLPDLVYLPIHNGVAEKMKFLNLAKIDEL